MKAIYIFIAVVDMAVALWGLQLGNVLAACGWTIASYYTVLYALKGDKSK